MNYFFFLDATFDRIEHLTVESPLFVTTSELLIEIRKGNSDALMELYRDHASSIFGAAYYVLNDKVLSEDICHNCFLKLYEKAHDIKSPEKLLGWMRQTARNEALMELRKNKRFKPAELETIELVHETEEDNTNWGNWESGTIVKLISELPEGYRAVLSMHLLDNLSHEEIGRELKISASTSRSQYLRGKKKLIENLSLNYA